MDAKLFLCVLMAMISCVVGPNTPTTEVDNDDASDLDEFPQRVVNDVLKCSPKKWIELLAICNPDHELIDHEACQILLGDWCDIGEMMTKCKGFTNNKQIAKVLRGIHGQGKDLSLVDVCLPIGLRVLDFKLNCRNEGQFTMVTVAINAQSAMTDENVELLNQIAEIDKEISANEREPKEIKSSRRIAMAGPPKIEPPPSQMYGQNSGASSSSGYARKSHNGFRSNRKSASNWVN